MNVRAKLKVGLVLLLCAGAASAQLYKWKDANGVTHFSDTPPAAGTGKVELKSYDTGAPAPELPPELAEAVKNQPVTLYTSPACSGCDLARAMLQTRGIPFSEKTVNTSDDHAALKKAGSDGKLPLLLIGRSKQIGFEQGTWDNALTLAAYPAQRMLPPTYQFPAPAPAARPREPVADKARPAKEAAKPAQPAEGAPAFQF
ncbi:MAG: glutaredoxin family protein [Pseudomonadota bacterium]